MAIPAADVTTLLGLAADGDPQAQDDLFRLVEGELRKRAHACLGRGQTLDTLQTTVLVDDAFLKLTGRRDLSWESRRQFYSCAATVMRHMLVDDARRCLTKRRGGGTHRLDLDRLPDPVDWKAPDPLTLLALHEALDRLAVTRPELVQIVELHHFGGWPLSHIATETLRLPQATVKRRWQQALAWLHRELHGGADDAGTAAPDRRTL